MLQEKIKQLGLSDKEAKVYLAALELGGESVQNIAKKSGVHRATTYQCLEKLAESGLVTTEKIGKKIFFSGQYPHQLLTNILDKQNELKKKEVEIFNLLPELNAIFNYAKNKPRVRFFEGAEELKKVYEDTLYNNQEILAFLSVVKPDRDFLKWLYEYYSPERSRRNIKAKVIAPKEKGVEKYTSLDKNLNRQTKLIDPQKYPFSIEIDIYGNNKVAFMSYTTKEMFGVIIESKEVYNTMKFVFQLVWNNIK
ncbi:MAG TPA: helix-turn-helix domain-containing protein [bacterium]|nr:helix-turn-helix domain-containing protein [bacterium]